MIGKSGLLAQMFAYAYVAVPEVRSEPFWKQNHFKTHGGNSVRSKVGRSPKAIKARRKANKAAGKARRRK